MRALAVNMPRKPTALKRVNAMLNGTLLSVVSHARAEIPKIVSPEPYER
jgi:hypothetical protein